MMNSEIDDNLFYEVNFFVRIARLTFVEYILFFRVDFPISLTNAISHALLGNLKYHQ